MPASNQVPVGAADSADNSQAKIPGGLDLRTFLDLKIGIHRYLFRKIDLDKIFRPDDSLRAQVLAVIQEVLSRVKVPLENSEREQLAAEVLDEAFGLGPLEPLMQDPSITDILVNGAREVYVERGGVLEETKAMFGD